MSKNWDKFTNKGFKNFSYKWSSIAYPKLKPGAYLLNCSVPKKYDIMAYGVRKAGYKIKDMINWEYGSGLVKNYNFPLAINELLGGEIIKGEMIIAPDGQPYDKRKKIAKPLMDYCYSGDIIE